MRWRSLAALLLPLATLLGTGNAPAAPRGKPVVIVVAAPLSGDQAGLGLEVREGVEAAARYWSGTARIQERPVEIVAVDTEGALKNVAREIDKAKPVGVVAAATGPWTEALAEFHRRGRIPCVLVSVGAPEFTVDPSDPILHFGGNDVDQALSAAGYVRIPMNAAKAAAIHDGSGPAIALARAFLRNLHGSTKDGGLHPIPSSEPEVSERLAELKSNGVEVVFVCADRPAALRVARAGGGPRPLFADGLLSEDIATHAPDDARWLVGTNPYLEDDRPARYRITRREKELLAAPIGERGYAAASLLLEAVGETKGRAREMAAALRRRGYESRLGAEVFTEWGQARYFAYHLWEPKADGGPAPIKRTYLPDHAGGLLLRHRSAARYRPDPDTRFVHLTWGEGEERTIDSDLRKIGLFTGGYEARMDEIVKEEILARAMARLNRLFWRNADGTPIPGVSFRISFGTELPEGLRRQNFWIIKIAGDDARAGGRAADPYALVFSTFIVRTMYLNLGLDPFLSREDQDYFMGQYAWGTTVDQNIRHDEIRCLLDGFAGALAMTGAHELGHLAGLGHDTASPRSIMNVEEGGGLEPDWAHWVPTHVRTLEQRLKRHERGRRRR